MKPLSLEVSKIGKHKATFIEFPESGVVQFVGMDEAGKTTLLRCIKAALSPARLLSPIERDWESIVTHGESKGEIVLVVGDDKPEYTITRIFRKGDPFLRVERADGSKVGSSPQALLDTFYNDICVDPMKFTQLKGMDLTNTALKSATFEVDALYDKLTADAKAYIEREVAESANSRKRVKTLEEYSILELLDKAEEVAFEKRQTANREVKKLEANLAEYADVTADAEEVDTKDIAAKRNELQQRKDARSQKAHQMTMLSTQIEEVKAQLSRLEEQYNSIVAELGAMPPVHDIEIQELDDKLARAADAERARTKQKYEREYTEWKGVADAQDASVKTIREYKAKVAASAKFPVEGMTYDIERNTVLYQNEPLEMRGGSKNLIIGAAVGSKLEHQPKFVLVDQGGEWDANSIQETARWAMRENVLLLMVRKEATKGEGVVSFTISDGTVQEAA